MWIYQDLEFPEAPEDHFGFVYLITNLISGRKYLGKKQFWSFLTKRKKGRKNKIHYKKEAKWRDYWGSCQELLDDIKALGENMFRREILVLCPTKGDLTFQEVNYQFKNDVLSATLPDGTRAFYNNNIMNRFFSKKNVDNVADLA